MSTIVLDASVFVSALLPVEVAHARATALLGAHRLGRFLVPALFELEVVAALARRGVPPALLDGAIAAIRSGQFLVSPVDERLAAAVEIARMARLRAYDAVYAALALEAGHPLATFDLELRTRLVAAYPHLELVG